MPDSMIERVARVLFQRDPGPYGDCVEWAIEQDFGWCDRVGDARAILTALRDLPPALRDKACESENVIAWGDYGEFWTAAIDAALAEGV